MWAMVVLLVSFLCVPAEGFGWWGNSVPVGQIFDEGTEKMGEHLNQFFHSLGRIISARQKWADSDSTADRSASQDSPFVVERIFHPGVAAKAKRGIVERVGNKTDRCSAPFGVSHPACSPQYICFISKARLIVLLF
jgi:hypothetical protein